jgi:surfactin synthase thioesterase subunit
LVGYSLGAQVAGEVGRRVKSKTTGNFRIEQIVGLDPARLFNSGVQFLNSGDADFVQVMHAETTTFGTTLSNGDVTFWPNEGRIQPTCYFYIVPSGKF